MATNSGDPELTPATAGDPPPPPASKETNLFLQILEHPDGTVTRPPVPVISPWPAGAAVISRDEVLDPSLKTWLRLFLPTHKANEKLPVILYFHGGGFVLFSAATAFYHAHCSAMAAAVPALVISLDYRLAPEHGLPAAYDDAVGAISWIRDHHLTDPWLNDYADIGKCFLAGSSCGANMAFHAALRLPELPIAGLILSQPYFGGEERTPSEAASEEDVILPLEANDKLWRLALPAGSTRDHEFSNPMAAAPAKSVAGLPRCLVVGCAGDPLIDRQREFAKWLAAAGVDVTARLDGVGFHSHELFVPAKEEELLDEIRRFVFAGAGADEGA